MTDKMKYWRVSWNQDPKENVLVRATTKKRALSIGASSLKSTNIRAIELKKHKYIIPYKFFGKPNNKGVRAVIGKKRTRTVESISLTSVYDAMESWAYRQGKKIYLYTGRRKK